MITRPTPDWSGAENTPSPRCRHPSRQAGTTPSASLIITSFRDGAGMSDTPCFGVDHFWRLPLCYLRRRSASPALARRSHYDWRVTTPPHPGHLPGSFCSCPQTLQTHFFSSNSFPPLYQLLYWLYGKSLPLRQRCDVNCYTVILSYCFRIVFNNIAI